MDKKKIEMEEAIGRALGIHYEEESLPFTMHTLRYLAKELIDTGYRKADEVRKETLKEIFNALYHQEEIGFDKIKWFAKYYYGIEVDE